MKISFPNAMTVTIMALLLSACSPADSNGAGGEDSTELVAGKASESLAGPTVAPVPASFPENFRGNWDYNENGCGEGESGTKFRITANKIIGYEDTSTLKSIQVVDDLTAHVVLENESSEGTQTLRQTLRLSPVAGISMRIEQGGETIRTLRCDPV